MTHKLVNFLFLYLFPPFFLSPIPMYRLVLSSVSDYFAAMFTSDVREAKQEEVKMEGVDPDALWVLVQYAYTGKASELNRQCQHKIHFPCYEVKHTSYTEYKFSGLRELRLVIQGN